MMNAISPLLMELTIISEDSVSDCCRIEAGLCCDSRLSSSGTSSSELPMELKRGLFFQTLSSESFFCIGTTGAWLVPE